MKSSWKKFTGPRLFQLPTNLFTWTRCSKYIQAKD